VICDGKAEVFGVEALDCANREGASRIANAVDRKTIRKRNLGVGVIAILLDESDRNGGSAAKWTKQRAASLTQASSRVK
jgi:hypothetical protein